ncbi:MAG: TrkH family potassium uptake protein [Clostridia bacterium]
MNLKSLKPAKVIMLGFFLVIFIGTILLVMPFSSSDGKSIGFLDALFTATSAVCVTGLVVRDTGTAFSLFGQTVILILIQTGGLGLMTFATMFSLLLGRKVNLKERLTLQETVSDLSLSGIVRLFKHLLIVVFSIELLGSFILSFRFIPEYGVSKGIWMSVFHSVSAFCNAGFDIIGTVAQPFASFSGYSSVPLVLLTISTLFIIGGLGFITWRDIFTVRRFRDFMLHTKIVLLTTLFLIVSGFVFIFILEFSNTLEGMGFMDKVLNAFFHATTPRTAGFNTLEVAKFQPGAQFVTKILMFIGGAPGSTAGGIKVTTFAIIVFTLVSYLRHSEDVNILKRKVSWSIVRKSISILFLGVTVVLFSTFVLLIAGEGSLSQVLFESISAFGTVGLSTGITPYLSAIGKIMIIITMFLGRVGPLAVAVTITFISGGKKLFSYPEGKISVG